MSAPLISCQNLSKSFGAMPLFEDLSLGVYPGERLGLIGANGSGKSTLLKMFAGVEDCDGGNLVFQKGISLAYIRQSDDLKPEDTILEAIGGDELTATMGLQDAGFIDFTKKVKELSGGWRKRLQIIKTLTEKPDLLLLDEPTNHLDLEGILWLEKTLERPDFAFVIVSHDRTFLESTIGRVIELGTQYEKGYFEVQGGYQTFMENKAEFLSGQASKQESVKNKSKREDEWLSRGPKARATKAKYRIEDAHRLKAELARLKQLNRSTPKAGLDFEHTTREGKKLIEAYNLGMTLGENDLFHGLKFKITSGLRLGLLGPNGSGKSSLMKLLTKQMEPTEGSLKFATDLRIVYFDQTRETLDPKMSVYRALCPQGDSVVYRGKSIHIYSWAKRFLFEPESLEMPVGNLSGGEQARVLLANLMLTPADVLLLDEPTNDLDIPALEVLEESLNQFDGAIVLVTHDRFLLGQVATELLALDGNGSFGFFPSFPQWQRWIEDQKSKLGRPTKKPKVKSGLSYQEEKELGKMEGKIEKLEARTAALNASLYDTEKSQDLDYLEKTQVQVKKNQTDLATLYARWEELENKSEG
ncbi:MAG: ABC-F family ATP-binding cassette domain-containing protein [SAR324 cluster bacterium]|nr:ABC-F family ATP-binding cassette domain-containing protein [SAR324 cluster bacterium]